MEKEKGGLPRTALQGGGKAEYFTAYDARTTENVNSLVFPVWLFSFLRISVRLSLLRLSSPPPLLFSLLRVGGFYSFFYFPPPPHRIFLSFSWFFSLPPPSPRAEEKARVERTDGVNPSAREKQKADHRLLSFIEALPTITSAKRGPADRAELLQLTVKYPDTSSWNIFE